MICFFFIHPVPDEVRLVALTQVMFPLSTLHQGAKIQGKNSSVIR